jgi:2-polyprenyl-3-methyl-5-hydroxy-6-metoxy-1,4-benzoquinol methylase
LKQPEYPIKKGMEQGISANIEIAAGDRFEFGKNWTNFLRTIDDGRIQQAMGSIQHLLNSTGQEWEGKTFLDVGSGSGLMSLAARKLGMRVVSFDFDPASVACTNRLREEYFAADPAWIVYHGSILDKTFLSGLGTFDFVYSWGVLHHTGDMWNALGNLPALVADKGSVVVALYNDQGVWSRIWKIIKATYNKLPRFLRPLFVVLIMVPRELIDIAVPVLKGRFRFVWERWTGHTSRSGMGRGMNRWHDAVDWIGGYPFEVSKPEDVFRFFRERGFMLVELRTCGGDPGCNEYVFRKG